MKNYKYIIFEITVVFIGVSSAFFLNNWRIGKDILLKEINYTERLAEDISYNIKELKDRINSDTTIINRSKPLLEHLYFNTLPEDSIISTLNLMASFGRINLKYTTYEEIIYNGDFNNLTNDSIRSLIIETKNLYEDITSRENFYEDFFHSLILPYIMENFDIMNNKAINNSIVNKVEFKNHFVVNTGIKEQTVSSYKKLYEKSLLLETLLIKSKNNLNNSD